MNILIHSNRKELDRNLDPVDYENIYELKEKWGGNVGNKLFLTAVDIYSHQEGIEVEYLTDEMTADYINDRFDLIIWPLANCFCNSKEIMGYLEEYTQKLSNYKVPVLALGGGAQADSYDDLKKLSIEIKETSCKFIDAVHATGGVFGLRGYFTKELFESWGYKQDYVTGCPSMYQMGRNLQIVKKSLNKDDIRLALNGNANSLRYFDYSGVYEEYPESWFIDQGDYVPLLYNKHIKETLNIVEIRKLMKRYSSLGIRMLADDHIVCLYDLPRLADYIKSLKINFSFGQRIHGNIFCTLLGIPSVVFCCDSRTRELAEFFEIPTYQADPNSKIDLMQIYEQADWKAFNTHFTDKYDAFENLLKQYGVPSISKIEQTFLSDVEKYKMPAFKNDYSYLKKYLKYKFFWLGID